MRYIHILLITVVAGCSSVATYPPVETDTALAFSNPTHEPVPTIIATTLAYAHEHFGGMDIIVFNLPRGIDEETYTIVAEKLGGAVPMTSQDQTAYHIVELRVRGFDAEADVIFPSTTEKYEMATIHLGTSLIDPWVVTRDRVWLVPIQDAPSPHITHGEMAEVDTASQ